MDLKRKALIILLFLLLFGLGFGREFVFERLNEVLGNKYAGFEVDYIYSFSHWLNQFSYWPLYYSKWVLTVVVSLLFLGLSLLALWVWHRKISYVKIALYFFIGIYSLSALIFGMGWLIGELDQFFKLTRMLMEIPQSPLLIMFLIPSLSLLPKD